MIETWLYAILSSIFVSLLSLTGIIFFHFNKERLSQIIFILVSFAVGILLGNVFFHLLPESYELFDHSPIPGILIALGIIIFFLAEKIFHWHHHQIEEHKTIKPLGFINIFADSIHNFTDGILIAAAWMVDFQTGIATTLAVISHEIPQEISDYGVLLHAGYSKKKALLYNLITAATALLGAILTLWIGSSTLNASKYILPLAAGGFIYLAMSDLIPELQKQKISKNENIQHLILIIAGLLIMYFMSNHCFHEH